MLSGEVEVDEAYVPTGNKGRRVAKPKHRGGGRRRGRSAKCKMPFFTFFERRSNRVVFVARSEANSGVVAELLAKHVARGSTVYTDEFRSYRVVERLGYVHLTVCYSRGVWAIGPVHVSNCECWNWHLRAFLFFKRGVSAGEAKYYASSASAFARLYAEDGLATCHWLIEVICHVI